MTIAAMSASNHPPWKSRDRQPRSLPTSKPAVTSAEVSKSQDNNVSARRPLTEGSTRSHRKDYLKEYMSKYDKMGITEDSVDASTSSSPCQVSPIPPSVRLDKEDVGSSQSMLSPTRTTDPSSCTAQDHTMVQCERTFTKPPTGKPPKGLKMEEPRLENVSLAKRSRPRELVGRSLDLGSLSSSRESLDSLYSPAVTSQRPSERIINSLLAQDVCSPKQKARSWDDGDLNDKTDVKVDPVGVTNPEVATFLQNHVKMDVPRSPGKRSVSDLGLTSAPKSLRSQRTLALLQSPAMRKHIAHTMGLDPDDPNFMEDVKTKLDYSHLEQSSKVPSHRRLEVGQLNKTKSASSGNIHNLSFSGDIEASSETLKGTNLPSHSDDTALLRKPESKTLSQSPSGGKFHVPSFDEFKILRRCGRLGNQSRGRPASTSFEFMEKQAIKEEPSEVDIDKGAQGDPFDPKMTSSLTSSVHRDNKHHNSKSSSFESRINANASSHVSTSGNLRHVLTQSHQIPKETVDLPEARKPPKPSKLKSKKISEQICLSDKDSKLSSARGKSRSKSVPRSDVDVTEINEQPVSLDDGAVRKESHQHKHKRKPPNSDHRSEQKKDKYTKPTSFGFVEVENDELIIDICENMGDVAKSSDRGGDVKHKPAKKGDKKPNKQPKEEITSDLEEEWSEGLAPLNNSGTAPQLSDPPVSVLRSTSDVSDKIAEEGRKRANRDKRSKPYKSDPFCTTVPSSSSISPPPSVIYEHTADGMSKDDVLSFLHNVTHGDDMSSGSRSRSRSPSSHADESRSEAKVVGKGSKSHKHKKRNHHKHKKSKTSSLASVEREDSGVGCETSATRDVICKACGKLVSGQPPAVNSSSRDGAEYCRKCWQLKQERKESIQEIVDTEISYCQDLCILRDEFYKPLQSSGLLSEEHMEAVFGNLQELVSISRQFVGQLQSALSLATQQGDHEYTNVAIGQPFLESSTMLLAFDTYCSTQAASPALLEQLMAERDLLRLFLEESRKENTALRRMDLKAFLMVPVQRVMKYPLLLGRLAKVTPSDHHDYEAIKKAKDRVEEILEHINSQTKGTQSQRSKRKLSWMNIVKRAGTAENIELSKAALEVLGWSRHEAYFLHTGHLHYTLPPDHTWRPRVKALKFTTVHAVLVSLGRNPGLEKEAMQPLLFPHKTCVKEAALVLLKEKGGKFFPVRDPVFLAQCVVSMEAETSEVFDLMEMQKDLYLVKGDDSEETLAWYRQLRLHSKDHGQWRRRRNALSNIMMHHRPSLS